MSDGMRKCVRIFFISEHKKDFKKWHLIKEKIDRKNKKRNFNEREV
jgi:hypothetical protein